MSSGRVGAGKMGAVVPLAALQSTSAIFFCTRSTLSGTENSLNTSVLWAFSMSLFFLEASPDSMLTLALMTMRGMLIPITTLLFMCFSLILGRLNGRVLYTERGPAGNRVFRGFTCIGVIALRKQQHFALGSP